MTTSSAPRRIDVHHHPSPPTYLNARAGRDYGYPAQQGWSVQRSLDDMEQGGVARAMLSLPHAAQIFPGDRAQAAALAREWNEFMARLALDHPGRFGVFAALPILDVDASLREIAYAFDTLKVDGVCLMTNIGERWLGDPHYDPVFEELHRRNAVVYTHPVAPNCCRGLLSELSDATIEYGTDTTRAIAKLMFTGSARRHRNIRFVFSHAGGTLPYIAERFLNAHAWNRKGEQQRLPEGVIPVLNSFYYDTAQAAHLHAMASFGRLIKLSQLVFGTDFPYRTAAEHVSGLAGCGFSDAEMRGIDYENAERLLARPAR